jgi:hypothetical protein
MGVLLDLFKDNLILPIKIVKYNEFIETYNEKITRAKINRPTKFKNLIGLSKIDSLSNPLLPSKNDS